MQFFFGNHPTAVVAVALVVLLTWFLSRPVAGRLGCSRLAAALLLLAVGVPLALTLPPSWPLSTDGGRDCQTWFRPVRWWGRGGEELANLALLLPLGVLAPVSLRARQALVVLVLAAGLPLAVELTQYAVPVLGRSCDVTDVVLNGLGLLAGAALGGLVAGVRWLTRPRTAPGPRPSASRGT